MPARFDNQALKQARLDLGMTQDEAAQRLDVDVRTYRRYETGQVNGAGDFRVQRADRRGFLAKVCAEFGLSEASLVVEIETVPELDTALIWPPRWVHPLPRAQIFVGRDELCAELGRWATTPVPEERLQVLVAAGGSGKSTLAERVASSLGTQPRPGGLFVWSYYADERSERMLASLLRYLEQDPKLESLPGERLERLVDHLENGAPHLLVFDGLEVVQSDGGDRALGELTDPTLSLLLKHVARGLGRTRALVTTRFPVIDLEPWRGQSVRSIELQPLNPAQGRRLLIDSGVQEAPAVDDLLDHYGGHPLSLAMVANYIARFLNGRADAWRLIDPKEVSTDIAAARRLARVLDQYARNLPPEERELLTLLSTFPGDQGTDDLIELCLRSSKLNLHEAAVRRALVRLTERGLVYGDPNPTAHAFVREHFADEALRERLLARKLSPRHRSELEVPDLFEQARFDTLSDKPRRSVRVFAMEQIQATFDAAMAAGKLRAGYYVYRHRFGGFDFMGLVQGEMAWGERLVRTLFEADNGQKLPQEERLELMYDWGLYLGGLGDFVRSGALFHRHAELVAGALPEMLAMALRAVAYNLRVQARFHEALAIIERSIEVSPSKHAPAAIALRGAILHSMGRMEEAGASFDRVRTMDTPVARRGLWEAEYRLDLGHDAWVVQETTENLAHCKQIQWGSHVAQCHVVLGTALVRDDPERARAHLREAQKWCQRTGEVELRLRAHELALRIHAALDHPDELEAERTEALRLAESSRAAWYQQRLEALTITGS